MYSFPIGLRIPLHIFDAAVDQMNRSTFQSGAHVEYSACAALMQEDVPSEGEFMQL